MNFLDVRALEIKQRAHFLWNILDRFQEKRLRPTFRNDRHATQSRLDDQNSAALTLEVMDVLIENVQTEHYFDWTVASAFLSSFWLTLISTFRIHGKFGALYPSGGFRYKFVNVLP
jgi:hypothetical protein